jgi:hypothetical protein
MVRLDRTAADTLRYYARTRFAKTVTTIVVAVVLTCVCIWQLPNAVSVVQGWAAAFSGRDELLEAQSDLSDALNYGSTVVASAPGDSAIDTTSLAALLTECEMVRGEKEPAPMRQCEVRVNRHAQVVEALVQRYGIAVQIRDLETRAAEAQAEREAAASAAAADAARKAAEEEARLRAEQLQQSPGSVLSTTVTCTGEATVTGHARGSGTVSVTISGAAAAGSSGPGEASATATGAGMFTIVAHATDGGEMSLRPSWTGSCTD